MYTNTDIDLDIEQSSSVNIIPTKQRGFLLVFGGLELSYSTMSVTYLCILSTVYFTVQYACKKEL